MSQLGTTDRPPVLFTLFGGFRMQIGSRDASAAPRKAEALLTYLAMQDGYSAPREAIIDLLWTDRGVEQARHSLRQTMFALRRIMGTGVFTDDTRGIGFLPGSIKTDVGEFRALVSSPARTDLVVAAQLYTGPLLDQFPSVAAGFDQWLERARSDLMNSAIGMLARLSHMCFADGHVTLGVSTAEHMLALDPLREDSHRALMLAYQQAGRRRCSMPRMTLRNVR